MIINILVSCIAAGLIGLLLYFFVFRNFLVYEFQMALLSMAYNYNNRRLQSGILDFEDAIDWFFDKHSYSSMVFSFKPLKLEYWYSEEELKRIRI